MKKTLFAAALLVFMAGCVPFEVVKETVAVGGAKAADSAVEVARWELCQAATIGAIRREFAGDAERAAAYVRLCADPAGGNVLGAGGTGGTGGTGGAGGAGGTGGAGNQP